MGDSKLPGWVAWLAQDADGSWWGYEVEPLQYHQGWYENELGQNPEAGAMSMLNEGSFHQVNAGRKVASGRPPVLRPAPVVVSCG